MLEKNMLKFDDTKRQCLPFTFLCVLGVKNCLIDIHLSAAYIQMIPDNFYHVSKHYEPRSDCS